MLYLQALVLLLLGTFPAAQNVSANVTQLTDASLKERGGDREGQGEEGEGGRKLVIKR